MKIAILTGWYPNSIIEEDGLPVRTQSKSLLEAGLDVSVVSVSLMRHFFKLSRFENRYHRGDYQGLREYRLEGFHPSKRGSLLFKHYTRQILKSFQVYLNDQGLPDLIHVHSYSAGLAAIKIKKKYGIPYILTEHSTSFIDEWVAKSHIKFIKKIFESAERIFAVSLALSNAMQIYSTKKIEVMPNFIDEELFCRPSVQPVFEEGPQLITVSTFTERKQIPLLIKAMPLILKSYPNVKLNIVGYGPEEYNLKALVHELNLFSNIIFKGPATQSEVAALMKENHLFVCASHTETFGVVYVEALACGLPVVAIDSGGVRDIVQDGVNGFIVKQERKLYVKIIEALDNYENYDQEEIVRTCVENFGTVNNVERHKELYTSICSKGK